MRFLAIILMMNYCGLILTMDSSLLPFFKPRGAVVIGASTSPEKKLYFRAFSHFSND